MNESKKKSKLNAQRKLPSCLFIRTIEANHQNPALLQASKEPSNGVPHVTESGDLCNDERENVIASRTAPGLAFALLRNAQPISAM